MVSYFEGLFKAANNKNEFIDTEQPQYCSLL